jgi:hypothetical protein
MTAAELARVWANERGLSPTPEVLALAARRISAWGRLATTPLVHLPAPVRVRVLEHGQALVPPGVVVAEVWVRAADAEQAQRLAAEVHRVVVEQVWPTGVVLALVVHRARWWDRWRR